MASASKSQTATKNGVQGSSSSAQPKLSKPDQSAYDKEQDQLNEEIAAVKKQINEISSQLNLIHAPRSGDSNDRRTQIRAEMDKIREQSGTSKSDRSKTFDAIKKHQEVVSAKIKEITALRAKLPFRSGNDIQARISQLNEQVESGTMKLIDEKKALNEISQLRRSNKTVASIDQLEKEVETEKAKIDALKKVLDDPEVKKTFAKLDELSKEMDKLRDQGQKLHDQRGSLMDKRRELSGQMDELWDRKRASTQQHRAQNDAYRARVQQEQKAKRDQYKAQKEAEDAVRREEKIQRMREEAKLPAYDREIEDCGVLIGWFNTKYGQGSGEETKEAAGLLSKSAIDGVKSLDIRKVDDQPIGTILQKRDDTEGWGAFAGTKKKGKGGKKNQTSTASGADTPTSTTSTSKDISLPFSTLNTLLEFGITPPANKDDVPRVIEDLSHKKAWFEANQKSKTEAEIEKVEKQIQKMQKGNGSASAGAATPSGAENIVEADVGGAKEPVHTVEAPGDAQHDVPQAVSPENQLPASPNEQGQIVETVDKELEEAQKNEDA